ncbi:MAG TPA: CPBP family intramembrane glutamic endopeptidase, partial [Verrucomicrobiales bacterium]|nr:CPBP family intramembrane glutamic endopeptidase [Verrucomicrobiales bacterium]
LPEQVLMFVTLCVGAPLMEELIFRGVLFSVASRFIHPIYANVATSLLFGVIHNNLLVLIPLTLLGMLFAYVYQRTRSLAVPVLMHAMFNGFQFLFLVNGWNESM